jgi:hypothetical protein
LIVIWLCNWNRISDHVPTFLTFDNRKGRTLLSRRIKCRFASFYSMRYNKKGS